MPEFPKAYNITPSLYDTFKEFAKLEKNLKYLDYVVSQDYVQDRVDEMNQVFFQRTTKKPFKYSRDGKIKVSEGIEKVQIREDEDPENKVFKKAYNKIVENDGLPAPNFLETSFKRSNTGLIAEGLFGRDLINDFGNLKPIKEGFQYKDKKLRLNPAEQGIMDKIYKRAYGLDQDRDFWDEVALEIMSLTWDLPFMALTNFAAYGTVAGALRLAGTAGKAARGFNWGTRLVRNVKYTNNAFAKYLFNVAQQPINFNYMGMPQLIRSKSPVEDMFHNAGMGVVAATFPPIGKIGSRKLQAKITSDLLKRNPVILDEASALASSLGFGTTLGLSAGEDFAESIGTGLAFAATHFTNPMSYQRWIQRSANRGRPIAEAKPSEDMKKEDMPTTYVEVDSKAGKAYPIDTGALVKDGEIRRLDMKPYDWSQPNVRKSFRYIWEAESNRNISLKEAMRTEDAKRESDELVGRWRKELGEEYFQENKEQLHYISNVVARNLLAGEKVSAFKRAEVPKDYKTREDIIETVNQDNIPVGRLEHYLRYSTAEYIKGKVRQEEQTTLSEYDKKYTEFLKDWAARIDQESLQKALEKNIFGSREPLKFEEEPPFDVIDHVRSFYNRVMRAKDTEDLRRAYEDYYSPFSLYSRESMKKATQKKGTQKAPPGEKEKIEPEIFQEYAAKNFRFTGEAEKDLQQWNKLKQNWKRITGEQAKEVEARQKGELPKPEIKAPKIEKPKIEKPKTAIEETPVQPKVEEAKKPEKAPEPKEEIEVREDLTAKGSGKVVSAEGGDRIIRKSEEGKYELVEKKETAEATEIPQYEKFYIFENEVPEGIGSKEAKLRVTKMPTYEKKGNSYELVEKGKIRWEGGKDFPAPKSEIEAETRGVKFEQRKEAPKPEPKKTSEQKKRDREISEKIDEVVNKRNDEILGEKKAEKETARERIKEIEELQKRMRERGKEANKKDLEMLERIRREYEEITESKEKTLEERESEILQETARDISNAKEETVKERIRKINEFLKEKIPDELKRATAIASVSEREKLPEQTQQLLKTLDALVRRRHDIRAEREEKGEEEVATPEARQNLLKVSEEKVLQKQKEIREENVEKLRDKVRNAIENTTGVRGKDKFQKVGEALGFPKAFNPILKAADEMGLDIEYVRPSESRSTGFAKYDSMDKSVEILGKAYGTGEEARGKRLRSLVTAEELLEESVAHEIIHGMTLAAGKTNAEAARFYDQELVPIAESIRKTLKEYYDADRNTVKQATGKNIPDIGSLKRGLDYMLTKQARGRPGGVEEMFTVAFTNPEVARYMDMIPANNTLKNKGYNTLWDSIVGIARKVYKKALGLPEGTLLDQFTQELSDAYVRTGRMKAGRPEITSKMSQTEIPGLKLPKNAPRSKRDLNSYASELPKNQMFLNTRGNIRPETKNAIERKYGVKIAPKNVLESSRLWETERVKADYYKKEKAAKSVEEQRQIDDYHTIEAKLNKKEFNDTDESLINKDIDAFKELAKTSSVLRLRTYSDRYLELNVPPIFKAATTQRFNDDIYSWGEAMIRSVPYQVNRILHQQDGWNSGAIWRKFAGIKALTTSKQAKITPEAKELLNKIANYHQARWEGYIDKDLTWNEFKDWAQLSEVQRQVIDRMEIATKDAIETMKSRFKMYVSDLHENVAGFLTPRKTFNLFPELFGDKKLKDMTAQEMNEVRKKINETPEYRERVAEKVVEDKYGGWGKTFYYNSVRPSDLNTFIFEGRKVDANGKVLDRFSTYYDSRAEMEKARIQAKQEGFQIDTAHQIKELITSKDFQKKLTPQQILELAFEGHLDMSNAEVSKTVDKLIAASEKGVDIHTTQRKYVPGMKFDAKEFENQLERFVREAIYSSHKTYYLKGIQQNLDKWTSEVNAEAQKKAELTQEQKTQLARKLNEIKYSKGYLNQLRQPERTVIDRLRGATIAFQVGGIKPAFMFQQLHQVFQTGFAQSIADAKANGLTTGDAIKAFTNGLSEAFKVNIELRKQKRGIPTKIKQTVADKEMIDAFLKLEHMNKIGAAGLTELTAQTAETDFTYSHGMNKVLQGAQRAMTWSGRAVEKMTRSQMAATYYRIGKQAGMSGDKLVNFMADGIDKSMAEWGKGGRAPLLDPKGNLPSNSPLANAMKKSFMTYKTFSFYNYGMWKTMLHNKQWSALTAKVLVGLGLHGVTKFPLFAGMLMAADMFTDEDVDYTIREAADEVDKQLGKAKLPLGLDAGIGEFLHRGIYSALNLDVRETFGEDTPIVSDLWAEAWSRTWEAKAIEIALGAPFGFSQDLIAGTNRILDQFRTDLTDKSFYTAEEKERANKVITNMLPIFLRNVLTAMNMKEDGVEYQGKTFVFADDLSMSEIVLKALSFPIEKRTDVWTRAKSGIEAQYNQAKETLRRGKNHRKELRDAGVNYDQIQEEMKKVGEAMNEARKIIRELDPRVRRLKAKRRVYEQLK